MIRIVQVPRDNDRRHLGFSRRLRKDSTDAEKKLWSILRSRQLAGFEFRRQQRVGGYILDFYCPKCRLAVELDGGQHNDPAVEEYDAKRSLKLWEVGVRLIRFSDRDMLKDASVVAEEIYCHLTKEE